MRTNFTIDDKSPMIKYTSAWRPGNTQDPFWLSYAGGGTFQVSETLDDTASFTFNGTAVYILGAKRDNHGPYSVTLDGADEETYEGFANPYLFQTVLDSRTGMMQGQHTISITNKRVSNSFRFLDIDSITWEVDLDEEASVVSIVDDADMGIEYLPSPSSWQQNACDNLTSHVNNTCHSTNSGNASMKISFKGDAVVLYGAVGPSQGTYLVQVDDRPVQTHSAKSAAYNAQQVLYFVTGLGMGNHVLTVTNSPSVPGENGFELDYLQIYTCDHQPLQLEQASSRPMKSGVIAGVVLGIIVLLVVLTGLGYVLWRNRRKSRGPVVLRSPSEDSESSRHPTMSSHQNHTLMPHAGHQVISVPAGSEYGGSQSDTSNPYGRVLAAVNVVNTPPPTNYPVVSQPAGSHMSHIAASLSDHTVKTADTESLAPSTTSGMSRSEKAALIASLGPPPPVPTIPLPPLPGEEKPMEPPPYYPKRI